MRQNIEPIVVDTAPIPPFDKPFKRLMPYADFELLNETQELALSEFYRKRKIYFGGIAVSGSLIGFTVGFFSADFSSSTAQFMAGAALSTNFITFGGLRRRYRSEDKFLRQIIQLRYDNKVMREQDKEALCKFAKKVKLSERVQEIIKLGEYLPYSETEVAAYQDANKTRQHDFTKKQYRNLLYALMTSRPDLECYMVIGLGVLFSAVLWNDDISIVLKATLWFVTLLFGGCTVWSLMRSRDIALQACVEGNINEVKARLNTAKRYTFFKVGDHLVHLTLSAMCLPVFLLDDLEMTFANKVVIFIAGLLTFLFTLFAMYRSVQSANRYKAAKSNQSKQQNNHE